MRTIFLLVLSLAPLGTVAAQGPSPQPPLQLIDTVRTLTLIYIYDGRIRQGASRQEAREQAYLRDSTAAGLRRVATAAGYSFAMRSSGLVRLIDSVGLELYSPPPNLLAGIVLLAPDRQPQLIPGFPSAKRLAVLLDEYSKGTVRMFVQPAGRR